MSTRTVTWGEALVVEMFKTPGGLKSVVDRIVRAMGRTIGTRNTFAKLFRAADPMDLGPADQWRAWLLLTAIHQDPSEWGLDHDVIPPYVNVDDLRVSLQSTGYEPNTRSAA